MFCRNCGQEISNEAVICVHCGVPAGKGTAYCANCGGEVHPEAVICVNCGVSLKKKLPTEGMKKRNIATAIILSIITCGIYSIYWFVKLTNEMNRLTDNEKDTSGGVAFLLSLVTCGIYSIYWAYRMGEKRDRLSGENSSSAVLYLVLMLFLGIAVYALAQDAINKAIENNK